MGFTRGDSSFVVKVFAPPVEELLKVQVVLRMMRWPPGAQEGPKLAPPGADVLVAGSYFFGAKDPKAVISDLKNITSFLLFA